MQIIKAGAKRRSSKKFTDKETISAKICVAFAFYKEVFFYKKFSSTRWGVFKKEPVFKKVIPSTRSFAFKKAFVF